ncbi:MAG TPA: FG-GAP-like repeat-containing protein [Gemmataceae bacterium]|nr:FG-GAP-like repeat-containing protein [Gemmataceae bacterium]
MKRRRVVWVVIGVLTLAAVAVLIPGSPVYFPDLMAAGGQHNGHSTRYWEKALDDSDPDTRKQAIFALGAIGPQAERAVPKLATIMVEDADREVRGEAALALSKMDPASKAAVPQLAKALEDSEPVVRMNAARALFRLKQDARPAVPALLKALADDENLTNARAFTVTVHELVALALGRATAGTEDGVPPLTDALKKASTLEIRVSLIRALGEVGPSARSALPLLRPLLQDKNRNIKEAAEDSVRRIEEGGQAAAPPGGNTALAAVTPDDLELPEAERQYLWQIEHHGNVLTKHGFCSLAAALKSGDRAALARLVADDFVGTDLAEPRRVRTASDFVSVERVQDGAHPPARLDRAAFVDRLMSSRGIFGGAAPDVKLALMTLSPKMRGQLDGPWQGSAQVRLFGEHAKGAPAEVVMTVRFEIPRPTEEVLTRPGWVRGAELTQTLTGKAPRYLFKEVARERGLDPSGLHDNWAGAGLMAVTGGVYVCDFDRDGRLDVLVTDVNGSTLYRGLPGGRFEDVTVARGLAQAKAESSTPPVAAWVDLDGDGWEDLILAGRVFRNEGGERFVDYTDRCNISGALAEANGIIVADYDRDGKLDLYLTRSGVAGRRSWLEGRTAELQENYLLRNLGNWKFEDVSRASGARAKFRSTFTAAWLDANNDGWPDLYVPNEFGDGVLLVNQGNGTFVERPLAGRPADFGTMGLAVGDINNDGNIDIYCGNMYSKAGSRVIGNLAPDAYAGPVMEKLRRFVAGSQLHLNRGGLKFDQVGPQMQVAAVGWAYGTCLADLDNDGWLDIYGTAGFVSRNRDEPDG